MEKLEPRYFRPESRYVQVMDAKLHVRIRGEGEPVFLLHGSFASLHTWHDWEEVLSKHYQTISVDFPGHGLSGANQSETYHTDYYADLIFALADTLDIQAFHVAGNSMGGNVAWKMALLQAERISSLTLIDAAGYYQQSSNTATTNTTSTAKRPFIFTILSNQNLAKFLARFTPRFLFALNLKQVYADESRIKQSTINQYYELLLREGNRAATLQRFQQRSSNMSNRLAEIQTPTLIIWGEKDSWIPLRHAHKFHELIPNSKLIIYENAGHVPMEEIPAITVADYLQFLQSLPISE